MLRNRSASTSSRCSKYGISLHFGDQPVEDAVVLASIFGEPTPRSASPVGPRRCGQHGQAGSERDPRRDDATEIVQLLAFRAEHRAQDDVQRDPAHRFKRLERHTLRPIGRFPQCLGLERLLVVLDALAMEWGRQDLAAAPVVVAVECEHRARSEDPFETRPYVADVGGVRHEQLLRQGRVGNVDDASEHGQVECEDVAVATRERIEHSSSCHREAQPLQELGDARTWRRLHGTGTWGHGCFGDRCVCHCRLQPSNGTAKYRALYGTVPVGTAHAQG